MGSNPGGSFNPQMPWLEPVDWEEFDALRWELLSQLSDSLSRGVQGSGEAESAVMPISYSLHQNYPNPFNPVTKIRFSQPEAGDVSLVIFDIEGREVVRLVNGRLAPGAHEIIWDAGGFSSGLYFARLSAGDFVKTIKMLLIK